MSVTVEPSTASATLDELLKIQPPARLFHYTTPGGLIGILKTKELWATGVDHLNDSSEIDYCIEWVRLLCENASRTHAHGDEVLALLAGFAECSGAAARHYFVASLTAESDVLSQWRAYSPDGGYALGLSSEQLIGVGSNQGFRLVKCCYDAVQMQQIIQEWIAYFVKKYELAVNEGLPPPEALKETKWQFSQHIARFGTTFKHEKFSEEREWRLVSSQVADADERVEFCVKEGNIAPYFRFALADATYPDLARRRDASAVIKVRCGPKNKTGRSQLTIQRLLNRYVGGGIYSPSDIPYRVK